MDATYDVTTPVGRVRLLISDTDPAAPVFSDDEVLAFLDMAGQVVLVAAADALEAVATNEALVLKVIRSQDLQTDGASLSKELQARADSLRARAYASAEVAGDGGFTFVPAGVPRTELAEMPGAVAPWWGVGW